MQSTASIFFNYKTVPSKIKSSRTFSQHRGVYGNNPFSAYSTLHIFIFNYTLLLFILFFYSFEENILNELNEFLIFNAIYCS